MRLLFLDFDIPHLLANEDFAVGGACVRQYAFAQGLTDIGHQVGILTWKNANSHVERPPQFELIESYSISAGIPKLRWFTYRFPALLKAARGYHPDFIFQKSAASFTGVMALIGRLLNVPFVYLAANDIDADDRVKTRLSGAERILYEYGLKKARAIICQNSYQSGRFKSKYPSKAVESVNNPFYYPGPLDNVRDRTRRKYIAWIGLFHPQKNLPLLFEITNRLPDFRFMVVGMQRGAQDQTTESIIPKLQAKENVECRGYLQREKIVPFLSEAYGLLNTSVHEGFSNTFLEAFAAGTPVVTLGENPDRILDAHQLGFVTNPENIRSCFERLKSDFDFIDYGRRSRDYLEKYHDYRESSKRLINILQKLT